MFETLDKMMLAGVGALSMSKERAEKIFDEYVSRGREEKANRSGFVKDIMDSAEKTRDEFEKIVNEQVHEAVKNMDLATHEDINQAGERKSSSLLKKE